MSHTIRLQGANTVHNLQSCLHGTDSLLNILSYPDLGMHGGLPLSFESTRTYQEAISTTAVISVSEWPLGKIDPMQAKPRLSHCHQGDLIAQLGA